MNTPNYLAADTGTQEQVTADRIRLIQEGLPESRDAWEAIVQEYYGLVYSLCMKRLRNLHDADQIAQDTFLRAFQKIKQLENPNAFKGWLAQIATRLSINFAVRDRGAAPAVLHPYTHHIASEPPTIDAITRQETIDRIYACIPALSEVHRTTFEEFYIRQKKMRTIAKELGVPLGTVQRRIHDARCEIRRMMEETA